MGKSGAVLRAAKAQSATYTFTRAQQDEHDRQVMMGLEDRVAEKFRERAKEYEEERKKEIDAYIAKEWEAREKYFRGDHDSMMEMLGLLLCCSWINSSQRKRRTTASRRRKSMKW